MSTADVYAEYASRVRYEELPDGVVDMAKRLILDSVGCALGALGITEGAAHLRFAAALGGTRESTVIGGGLLLDRTRAAFVNCQLANLLDFDDTYDVMGPAHPGCLIVPAALAVGEAVGATGGDVIAAVVTAYELTLRLGSATGSILWSTGGPGGTVTSLLGPLVAAARLMGLDRSVIRRALDVMTLESGLSTPVITRTKYDVPAQMKIGNLKGNYGQAAELGVLAAIKAVNGLTGMPGLLDLDRAAWYLAGFDPHRFDDLSANLGEEYRILLMSFKPTPSCRWSHVPITAAWEALGGQPVTNDQVRRIVIKGVNRLERYDWQTILDAQFSIPCALALAVTGTTPGPDWYAGGRFTDPDIRELAHKVVFERDPEAEALELTDGRMSCEVEITFVDGTVRSARCVDVKGSPDNPMTDDELISKFEVNASRVDGDRRGKILDQLQNLERIDDVASVMSSLGAPVAD